MVVNEKSSEWGGCLVDGFQAENDGDELTVKLKDVRKEVERGEIVLKYSVVKGFLAAVSLSVWGCGMRRSPARVVALWRVRQLFLYDNRTSVTTNVNFSLAQIRILPENLRRTYNYI